ncbi:hypothetical protein Tco_1081069 [Tanacetum coccineum]|uniref:Uncharacterized protein n=1 Tax=Tanacetum coccineum TaxID=301880 RepID=A0ABQ5HXE7_9ASTR
MQLAASNKKIEYKLLRCSTTLTDKLDVEHPKGYRYSPLTVKPIPLRRGRPGYLTIVVDYFFNNDMEYIKTFDLKKTYTTSITKTKTARYKIVGIEDMVPTLWSTIKHAYDKDAIKGINVKSVSVKKLHGYGYLEEIVDVEWRTHFPWHVTLTLEVVPSYGKAMRKKEKSLDYNNSFFGEYECSSLALDKEETRDEKEEIGSLETRSNNVSDQEIYAIQRTSKKKLNEVKFIPYGLEFVTGIHATMAKPGMKVDLLKSRGVNKRMMKKVEGYFLMVMEVKGFEKMLMIENFSSSRRMKVVIDEGDKEMTAEARIERVKFAEKENSEKFVSLPKAVL